MSEQDRLVSRIYLRSILPLVKVLAEEKPLLKKAFPKRGVIQFITKEDAAMGAAVVFEDGIIDVEQGVHVNPDLVLTFKTLADMNTFFGGGMALPGIKGIKKIHLLIRILPLLLGLKILMPDALPTDPAKRALKVKLTLFMITNALSQLNKGGDPLMTKFTKGSPDRIYQWTVTDGPAAYLRVKNGKTKSGRGTYTRRRPFVHMKFPSIDGAFMVLTSQVALVDAVSSGHVVTEGAMEGSKEIGLLMQRVEELVTP